MGRWEARSQNKAFLCVEKDNCSSELTQDDLFSLSFSNGNINFRCILGGKSYVDLSLVHSDRSVCIAARWGGLDWENESLAGVGGLRGWGSGDGGGLVLWLSGCLNVVSEGSEMTE